MYRILFLDFDGPLTNSRCYIVYDAMSGILWKTADPLVIDYLNALSKKYEDLRIVVSSSWRNLFALNPTGTDAIESLRMWGFEGKFHKDWKTPYYHSKYRSMEIKDWLIEHKDEVKTYTSLDDEHLPEWTNNIRVHPNNGMTDHYQFSQLDAFIAGEETEWTMDRFIQEKSN